jgi:hypothetical protein
MKNKKQKLPQISKTKIRTKKKKVLSPVDICLERMDIKSAKLTQKQLFKLIEKLLERVCEGDERALVNLAKRIKENTHTNEDIDQGEHLWLTYLDEFPKVEPQAKLSILKSFAASNSPAIISEATNHLCFNEPLTKGERLSGIHAILARAIRRYESAQEGDLLDAESRAKVLAATLKGILAVGDPTILPEIEKVQGLLSIDVHQELCRDLCQTDESTVRYLFGILKRIHPDSSLYRKICETLYQMTEIAEIGGYGTGGIETYKFNPPDASELINYQSFAYFIKNNERLLMEIENRGGNNSHIETIREDWLANRKTQKPRNPFAVDEGSRMALVAALKAKCLDKI